MNIADKEGSSTTGSPGQVIPKTVEMVPIASLLGTKYLGWNWGGF